MDLRIDSKSCFVFDLDDTLFPEIDFLTSAYRHIAMKLQPQSAAALVRDMLQRYRRQEDVFSWLIEQFGSRFPTLDKKWLLQEYREHPPAIGLAKETAQFLETIKKHGITAGLVTDGRSVTQRNKLRSLGLENYFQDVIISEEFGSQKPDERNFLYFEKKYPEHSFYFFGDNTSKDFVVPAKLGWRTICLEDNGQHIHAQDFSKTPPLDHIIHSFEEIILISQY